MLVEEPSTKELSMNLGRYIFNRQALLKDKVIITIENLHVPHSPQCASDVKNIDMSNLQVLQQKSSISTLVKQNDN